MADRTDRQTHQFPDRSVVEVAIRTSDATTFRVFPADVARRFRSAQRTVGGGAAPGAGRPFRSGQAIRAGRDDVRPARRRCHRVHYRQWSGEPGVPALGGAGAVEYTNVVHVEIGRATLLAVALIESALALVAAGGVFLSVPLFGRAGPSRSTWPSTGSRPAASHRTARRFSNRTVRAAAPGGDKREQYALGTQQNDTTHTVETRAAVQFLMRGGLPGLMELVSTPELYWSACGDEAGTGAAGYLPTTDREDGTTRWPRRQSVAHAGSTRSG